ncbi:MAG: hypothetical protein ACXWWU_09730, partial [Candidatus Limnocylindria bacterium]
ATIAGSSTMASLRWLTKPSTHPLRYPAIDPARRETAAIEFQDVPVIMGVLVVLGLIGVGFRLATDLAIAILDPRQRRGRA